MPAGEPGKSLDLPSRSHRRHCSLLPQILEWGAAGVTRQAGEVVVVVVMVETVALDRIVSTTPLPLVHQARTVLTVVRH